MSTQLIEESLTTKTMVVLDLTTNSKTAVAEREDIFAFKSFTGIM
jgi:hypothetical protein